MSLLWTLDSSLPSTLFADAAKTVPITDGTGVAAAVSAGGSIATDALQSTSGSRPTYRANYSSSGYSALEFDGTADHFAIAHSAAWNVSILDVFAVLTLTSSSGSRGVISKWSNTSWSDGWGIAVDGGNFRFGAPNYTNAAARYTGGTRMLLHVHFENAGNGGQFGLYYGGGVTGAGPQNNSASVFIGRADPSGAFYMAGAINEICFFGGGETDQAIVDTKQMLRAKWGLASVAAGVTGFTGLSGVGRLGT
jgi:hypothetical protein